MTSDEDQTLIWSDSNLKRNIISVFVKLNDDISFTVIAEYEMLSLSLSLTLSHSQMFVTINSIPFNSLLWSDDVLQYFMIIIRLKFKIENWKLLLFDSFSIVVDDILNWVRDFFGL
jgi:hypothetical protein